MVLQSALVMRIQKFISLYCSLTVLVEQLLLWSYCSSSRNNFAMGFSCRYLALRRGGMVYRRRAVSGAQSKLLVLEPRVFSSTSPSALSRRSTIISPILSTSSSSLLSSSLTETDAVEDCSNANKDDDEEQQSAMDDTIFALSSGFTGEQATAVAVIRISGPQANTVLGSLLQTSPSSKPRLPKYRQAALRKLYHPVDHSILDHALILSFKGPNSFTGEDLVELQCHGSRVIVQRLLNEALPSLGCRLAEPGEFTQRAFSQGKLDLLQVEALADILGAETHLQVEQGLKHLDGAVSKTYEDWRSQLISGLAHAEAVIDFGDDEHLLLGDDDEDDDGLTDEALQQQQESVWGEVGTKMMHLQQSMEYNLEDGRRGELIREGIKVAIIGKSCVVHFAILRHCLGSVLSCQHLFTYLLVSPDYHTLQDHQMPASRVYSIFWLAVMQPLCHRLPERPAMYCKCRWIWEVSSVHCKTLRASEVTRRMFWNWRV